MAIRLANLKDAEKIVDIANKIKIKYPNPQNTGFLVYILTKRQYEQRIKQTSFFYVSGDKDINGFLMCYDDKTLATLVKKGELNHENNLVNFILKQQRPYIFGDQIGVLSENIREGIGENMMGALFKDMKRKGIKDMYVGVLHKPFTNQASIEFCDSFGFKYISEVINEDNLAWGIYLLELR